MSVHRTAARRLLLTLAGLALTLGMLPVLTGAAPGVRAAFARADDDTVSQDMLRTGWDKNEAGLAPTSDGGPVGGSTFTQVFSASVGGSVYAQPLVVPVGSGSSTSTVVVATENDWVYGLDPATGAINWQTHLGSAFVIGKSTDPKLAACGDLTPNIGVTGTPVFDPGSGNVYMFANITDSGTNNPKYYLVGVHVADGSVTQKTLVAGHPSNESALTFSAAYEMERPGALLLNGWVYGAFASHCDHHPYTGYIAGVNLSTSAMTLWTDEAKVTDDQAGIWQSGGGLVSDGSSIFVTSGNGVSPGKGPGSKPPGTLAESVIRLTVNSNGTLSPKDFFSPANAPKLDAADTDFGAGGPLGIPFVMGNYSHVLAAPAKDGRIWLLNRDNLGGREQASHSGDNALFVTKNYGGVWGHPATFGDISTLTQSNAGTKPVDNDFLFSVGKNDVLRVFRYGIASNNKPVLSDVGASSLTYGFSSGSPVVTSNGTDPKSVVVWVVQVAGNTGTNAELDAYSLGKEISNGTTPSSCTSKAVCILTPIWHSSTFTAVKFTTPATSGGRVYVGTRDGHLLAFGVAGAAASPVQAATALLPSTTVSSTSTKVVSITARKKVTITGVTAHTGASNAKAPVTQFAVGQTTVTPAGSTTSHPVTFPVTLARGDKLNVLVNFTPAAPGTADGVLLFRTSTGRVSSVPVTGTGARTGLYADPSAVDFPLAADQGLVDVPVGVQVPQLIDIINGGSTNDTVRSVTPPSAPFAAANLPVAGQTLVPGQSLVVALTYTPGRPGPAHGSFTITDSTGKRLIVPLSGVATASVSKVTATQPTVDFGSVPVGTTVTKNVQVTNTGNVPATVSVPVVPKPPFHSRFHVFSGLPFNPTYDLVIPVMFTPTAKGTFTFHYVFHWKDRLGNHSLTVVLTGKGV